jgi:hypothetical protein
LWGRFAILDMVVRERLHCKGKIRLPQARLQEKMSSFCRDEEDKELSDGLKCEVLASHPSRDIN